MELWHKYKQQLYDASIFEHDSMEQQRIYIHTKALENEEVNLLDKIFLWIFFLTHQPCFNATERDDYCINFKF